jgi:hypothetical protein
MIRAAEVREKLKEVAFDLLSVDDFAEWLEEKSWSMHRDSSPSAIELVSSIHCLLAQHDDQFLSDVALRRELVVLLNNAIDFGGEPVLSQRKRSSSTTFVYAVPA